MLKCRQYLAEVNGCTLADPSHPGFGLFPDAPAERGIRHLREVMKAVGEDYNTLPYTVKGSGKRARKNIEIKEKVRKKTEGKKHAKAHKKRKICLTFGTHLHIMMDVVVIPAEVWKRTFC